MKAIVNEGCIGCGLCASTCPAVFTLEDGVAVAMAGGHSRGRAACGRRGP